VETPVTDDAVARTELVNVPATQQYTAVGYDAHNNVVSIAPTWGASAGGTISGSGLFTAGTVAGTFSNAVSASVGICSSTITGRATVTVLPGSVASVTVSPSDASMLEGATQQFAATAADSHGNAVTITPVWSVSNVGGGTIDASSGLYTAGSVAGTFTSSVRATASSVTGVSTVTVTAPSSQLAWIVITPTNPSMYGAGTKQFTATGYDASMNVMTIPGTLTWSLNTLMSVGSIDSNGLFTFNGSDHGSVPNLIHVTNGTISASTSVFLDCGC
jgi:hypothetical protein